MNWFEERWSVARRSQNDISSSMCRPLRANLLLSGGITLVCFLIQFSHWIAMKHFYYKLPPSLEASSSVSIDDGR